jgi:hypothetical protein
LTVGRGTVTGMALMRFCDGCGKDIPTRGKAASRDAAGDLVRGAEIYCGGATVAWDLCEACFEKVIGAVAAVTPHSPRAKYDAAMHGRSQVDGLPLSAIVAKLGQSLRADQVATIAKTLDASQQLLFTEAMKIAGPITPSS